MPTINILKFAALAELLTGLTLLAAPSLIGTLLFDQTLAGIAVVAARVAGIALVSLSIVCWSGAALRGMALYSGGITVYFAIVGLTGGMTGILLWPVVALHAVLTVALAASQLRQAEAH